MASNNEQKKIAEERYLVLVKTHKQMNVYIEKLETKVKHFQEKYKKISLSSSNSLSKEYSSISSSPQCNEESKSYFLTISPPITVFSC